jgi:3-phenylpropionate/cinnamic acid dioxygenase small subunit
MPASFIDAGCSLWRMPIERAALELWFELVTWLDNEASLLDNGKFDDWLELLTEDVQYVVPVRLTRERGAGSDVRLGAPHFQDDLGTLRMRMERLKTEFAWAEDPPSRTRRFVTNVRPNLLASADLVEVRSNLLMYRSRGDDPRPELISCERRDVLRRTAFGLRLHQREVLLDQATLPLRNLAVML